ncbi:MAG: ABC transporter ATP-binding protein [Balneolaceae bacterium]
MIHIDSLIKAYVTDVVLDISHLTIPRSQCFGLVGNNGAGKTTFLRLILDLIRATSGSVTIEGEDVTKSEEWKQSTGSYLDEHMLLGYLTADEYFEVLRKIHGMSEEDLRLHNERFAPFFNEEILGHKKYVRDLSKGNKKRVGISAAFFGNPQLVLLDEPFESLDPSSQIRLKKIIEKEKEEKSTTFLISSHDLDHVTEVCERIVLLEKGNVKQDISGTKEEKFKALNSYFSG